MFRCKKTKTWFTILNVEAVKTHLMNFTEEDDLVFTIEKKKTPRSLSQNSYIHALFTECAPILDMTPVVAKHFLKLVTGRYTVEGDGKNEHIIPMETRGMSTKELGEFIDAIKKYMWDVHVYDVSPIEGRCW